MAASTFGYIEKGVTPEMIYDIICDKYDKEAVFDVKNYGEDGSVFGFIHFKVSDKESRNLFYSQSGYENDLFGGEYASLSLGHNNSSVDIITNIIKEFGGYIEENDCDDGELIYIEKDGSKRSEKVNTKNKIIELLDWELTMEEKVKTANEIIRRKDDIISLFANSN